MAAQVKKNVGETLEQPTDEGETRVHLCGRFTVRLHGERVEHQLPGRQGRVLFAFLAAHRNQSIHRRQLIDALWPDQAPAAAETAVAALLTKLRRALGNGAVDGKHEIQLLLPERAWVDIEAMRDALHRAESAINAHDWARAWGPARVASHIAIRGFMPGYEAPWITSVRREVSESVLRADECVARSGLGLGGAENATAERAARRLMELAPLRETGYRLLMLALAERGESGEALMVYERWRTVLREELGASPGTLIQAVHRGILTGTSIGSGQPASATRTTQPKGDQP